jgi:hypothetical protein
LDVFDTVECGVIDGTDIPWYPEMSTTISGWISDNLTLRRGVGVPLLSTFVK